MGVVIKRTFSERTKRIALNRGIPYNTVETVLKDYLDSLLEDAVLQNRIVLDGITSISIIEDIETGELYPRGRVSPALKSRIQARAAELREKGVSK